MLTEPQSLNLVHARGIERVSIGDRFVDDALWEVIGWSGDLTYSPSGLGGTPIVVCRPLTAAPVYWQEYLEDGLCEWCGDSVAAKLSWDRAFQ